MNPRLQDEKRQSHLIAMPPHRREISDNKIEIKKLSKKFSGQMENFSPDQNPSSRETQIWDRRKFSKLEMVIL